MYKTAFSIITIISVFLAPINAYADSNLTIAQNAIQTQDLTTLVASLEQAELTQSLDNSGELTVFAPNNNAFSKLGDNLSILLQDENKTLLQDILKYHVISGEFESSQLSQLSSIEPTLGSNISVSNNAGEISLNSNSRVVEADISASNGVIHIVDTVLLSNELELRLNTAISDSQDNLAAQNENNTTNLDTESQASTPRTGAGENIIFLVITLVLTFVLMVSLKGVRGLF